MDTYKEISNKKFDTITHHIMAICGGFMACYAVMLRSDFIGNAQTSNLLYVVLGILGHNTFEVLIRIGGALLYAASTVLFVFVKNKSNINVKYFSLMLNSISIVILAMIPADFNAVLALYPIFFAMAFQWNSFPGDGQHVSSTIFSTNNLRQCSLALGEYLIDQNIKHLDKLFFFLGSIICFHIGAIFAFFCIRIFNTQAIWFAFVPIVLNVVVLAIQMNYLCENNAEYDGNYSKI